MSAEYSEFVELLKMGKPLDAARFAERELLAGGGEDSFWLTQQAVAFMRARRYEDALPPAKRALELQPRNPYGLLAVADALLGLGKVEDALAHYREAAENDRAHDRAMRGVFECLGQLSRWTETVEIIEQEPSLRTSALRWHIKALVGLGRSDEAVSVCRKRLRKSPDNSSALWALAELEIQSEGLDAVISRIGKVARIPSRPPVYREIYASLCRRAGRPEEAVEQYEKIASGRPSGRIEAKKAFVLAKSGREKEAIPLLEDLLRDDPANMYLHSSYAAACRRIEELPRAERFYGELLSLHPEEKSLFGRMRGIKKQMGTEKREQDDKDK